MSKDTHAVLIARVSSKRQEEEGYSLPAQKKLLRSYALDKGLDPVKTFEIAESASKSIQRRIFKEAMKYIEDNQVKHLITEKVDRHIRNLNDAVETHDWVMADEAKRVHFVKDSLVMHKNSRSQEWLNWGFRVVMSKNYIDNLREESMKGMAEKLAQGWLPAPPPPGYMTVTQHGKRIHVPNPETKDRMVKVFKKYLEPGETLDSCVKYMKDLGIVTKNNHPFSKSHVQRILTNPYYIGINRFNKKEYPGLQELIMPKDIFKRVQVKLHRGRPRHFSKHYSPLQGLIRCEDCNSIVTWQLQKGRYYGVCRRLSESCKQGKMLREDYVEAMVMEELKRLVCPSPDIMGWVMQAMRDRYQEQVDEKDRMISELKLQLRRIGNMDETLYDDKLSGEITNERYRVKHEELMNKQVGIEEQIDEVDRTLGDRLEQRLAVIELSQKAAEIYARKPPEQKRLIISKLFDQMTLQSGSLSVKYSKFVELIAEKVQNTRNLMEGQI